MTQHPFPGPGHDGDEPVPGVPARDGADDVGERYLDYLAAEIEAGREEPPPEEPPPGPVLGTLTSQAVEDVASLPDDELLSVVLAVAVSTPPDPPDTTNNASRSLRPAHQTVTDWRGW